MRAGLRNQDGYILATSITLLAIMMTTALATLAFVDTGQKRTREQRERESSLNLTEGVLYAQGFKLAQGWPGALVGVSGNPVTSPVIPPSSCTHATGSTNGCPNPAQLAAAQGGTNFNTVDQTAGVTWVTRVRDNGGALSQAFVTAGAAYDQPQAGTKSVLGVPTAYTCAAPCTWDANGDRQLWVQARSVVRGKPRNVVALLRLETVREAVPETAVTAGGIAVTNSGNKVMVYAEGSQVVLRCNNATDPACADYDTSPVSQIVPAPTVGTSPPNFLTAQQLARFKARAIADGTHFDGCPPNGASIAGSVVWIESCTNASFSNSTPTQPCSPTAPNFDQGGGNRLDTDCVNQKDTPGLLIAHCGALSFSGGFTYVGVVYAANNSDGTCVGQTGQRGGACNAGGSAGNDATLIDISGGFGVWGSIAIDGPGCLRAGSNAVQIQFDPNVFNAATSYGTVGLVQNTWRELPPN